MRVLPVIIVLLPGLLSGQGYVVADGAKGFGAAVKALVDGRGADVVPFDPADPEALLPALRERAPRHVAFVVAPGRISPDLVRRVLALSTRVDDDPFPDFTYGFVTGADGKAAAGLVAAGLATGEKKLVPSVARVLSDGNISGRFKQIYVLRKTRLECLVGWVGGGRVYREHGRDVAFLKALAPDLVGRGVVLLEGDGRPTEIVGGLRVEDVRRFRLDGRSVILSGCAFTGVTGPYGDGAQRVAAGESLAVAVLGARPVAYAAWMGRPPERSTEDSELCALLVDGATVGEASRRRQDQVVLGLVARGAGAEAVVTGAPDRSPLVRAAGRVLYGDPAARPFQPRPGDHPVAATTERKDGAVEVRIGVTRDGYLRHCADPMTRLPGREEDAMMLHARVFLEERHVRSVSLAEAGFGGRKLEARLVWAVEEDQGARFVHVKAVFPEVKPPAAPHARILVRTTDDAKQASTRSAPLR